MRLFALLILVAISPGCSEEIPELPKATSPDRLLDCTSEFLQRAEEQRQNDQLREMRIQPNYQAAVLSPDEKKMVLDSATTWASVNSYLPCHYQMCAAILSDSEDTINVHILPEVHIDGWIAPNAKLWVSLDGGTITEEQPYHTGCAHRAQLGIER